MKSNNKLKSYKVNIHDDNKISEDVIRKFNKDINDIKNKLMRLEEDKEKIDEADYTVMKNNFEEILKVLESQLEIVKTRLDKMDKEIEATNVKKVEEDNLKAKKASFRF